MSQSELPSPRYSSTQFSQCPTLERDLSPVLDPNREYTDDERLAFALASWHAKKREAEKERLTTTKRISDPKAAPIARLYSIDERTLQRHIRGDSKFTRAQQHKSMQRLTEGQETALTNRLLYLDEWNIPADRTQVVILAEAILHSCSDVSSIGTVAENPESSERQTLGKDWFYSFQSRHRDQLKFVSAKNKDKLRCNAEDWHLMNDFYTKV